MSLPTALKTPVGKLIAALLGTIVLGALIYGTVNYFRSDFAEREAEREAERKEWLVERQVLLNKIAGYEALTEAAKKAVEAKRKDTLATIEELQQVEQTHEQTKEQIEQQIETGRTESLDKLRRDMDDTLCRRGYKAFCPK